MPGSAPLEKRGDEAVGPLSSLVLGAALFGRDVLAESMRGLETRAAEPPAAPVEGGSPLRYATVGLIFEGERIAVRSMRQLGRATSAGLHLTRSVADSTGATKVGAGIWGLLSPISAPVERQLAHLVEVGKEQEAKARSLADSAFRGVTEVSIGEVTVRAVEGVAHSEKVREVLRAESMGAAEAAVDEVRGIAKEADTRLENIARAIFRRGRPRPLTQPDVQPT